MHISSLNRVLSRRSSLLYHCCCIALPLQSYLLRPAVSLAFGYIYQPSFLHPTQQQISLSKLAMSSSTNNSSNIDSSSNKDNLPRVDFTKTETVGTTRWMRLETLSYHVEPDKDNDDKDDGLRKWDRAVRTTKQSENSIDAVVILAILKNNPTNPLQDEVVCVKQFRPPVNAYTIELPAGLIDANEDISTAALREFTEETGYINGKVTKVLPASYLSPGLTNESASLVRIEIDMSLEQNRKIHTNQVKNEGLEGCEKDRGLEKVLLPRVGLLKALHDLQEKEGVKVFAALYSLALGMEVGESEGLSSTMPSTSSADSGKDFPLVELELDNNNNPTQVTCQAVKSALRDSGFLIIKTSLLPLQLQQRALSAASSFLDSSCEQVITHPQDPKRYAMLEGVDSVPNNNSISSRSRQDLQDWYTALQKTKSILLQCISVGLGMKDINYFVKLHDEDNDALRLIKYEPGDAATGNRCKEHSDYGTITLLLNDGVGGLEAYVNDKWKAVPYIEGGIVVNIGSILSEWTRQELKATLHRVAGPASIGSTTPQDTLLKAVAVPRISLAYFADPNKNVSTVLEDTSGSDEKESEEGSKMSIEEYIQYRSGGQGDIRSGVAFTSTEESRLGI